MTSYGHRNDNWVEKNTNNNEMLKRIQHDVTIKQLKFNYAFFECFFRYLEGNSSNCFLNTFLKYLMSLKPTS